MGEMDYQGGVSVEIGGMPILLRSRDKSFCKMLAERYTGFVGTSVRPEFELEIDLREPDAETNPDEDVQVRREQGKWLLRRGDFRANWDPQVRKGLVVQTPNPYAIDSVLRIIHTLVLASQGGFLIHAASAISWGRAFLFAGVSGAGKTTISRLAPAGVTLLTDEISYVRRQADGYVACGTPFAGELAKLGENTAAPLHALFLLKKGEENRIEDISGTEAVRLLLKNVLFFAEDHELVSRVFQSACEFVKRVPVRRLTFVPDQRVWEMIS